MKSSEPHSRWRAFQAACALFVLAASCGPYGKAEMADEEHERERRCSDVCDEGTCDNLGYGKSIHDIPCTPNHAAKLGDRCSKDVNCAEGLRCTDIDGWHGHCARD